MYNMKSRSCLIWSYGILKLVYAILSMWLVILAKQLCITMSLKLVLVVMKNLSETFHENPDLRI